MIVIYSLLILMTMLGSVAALFLKKSTLSNKFLNIFIGGSLYFVTALMNIYILKFLDYSVVLPLTSLTYVWTLILAKYSFREDINARKSIGILLILVGAVLVAK